MPAFIFSRRFCRQTYFQSTCRGGAPIIFNVSLIRDALAFGSIKKSGWVGEKATTYTIYIKVRQ